MKKLLILMLIFTTISFGCYLYFDKVMLGNNKVFAYGESHSIQDILRRNDITNVEVQKYQYRRAIVKDEGSTVHYEITLDDDKIVFLGNRNLVKINGTLYVYE